MGAPGSLSGVWDSVAQDPCNCFWGVGGGCTPPSPWHGAGNCQLWVIMGLWVACTVEPSGWAGLSVRSGGVRRCLFIRRKRLSSIATPPNCADNILCLVSHGARVGAPLGPWSVGTLVVLMYGQPWGGGRPLDLCVHLSGGLSCFRGVWVCCPPSLPSGGVFCCVGPLRRVFAVLPWGWDCGCPQTGWPFHLFCPAGVIGFSLFLCCLWPVACFSEVGVRCPGLTHQSPSSKRKLSNCASSRCIGGFDSTASLVSH